MELHHLDGRRLWGPSTERALANFPISGHRLPPPFVRALALVKQVAARVNGELGELAPVQSALICTVAREIANGEHLEQFPVDVFQTGSGTSTNTNMNEVIARRAAQLEPSVPAIHPNDHVNRGQSSNDVIPTALHLSVALALRDDLGPALLVLERALSAKAREFKDVVKLGRTHLMDALPMTLGQEFSGYARQIEKARGRVQLAITALSELALGGTAVGTGLHAPVGFAAAVARRLSLETGLTLREASNHFEAQGARDDCVEVAGHLATIAGSLTKIAADLRLLSSGPHAGLGELRLPTLQPGSSIMPGKVNPVLCESVIQVGLYVNGLTHTAIACGREGVLELNTTLPLLAWSLHESIGCLANVTRLFAERCVAGLEADVAHCADLASRSVMLVTALTPSLGYDVAAQLALEAERTGASVRELVISRGLMSTALIDQALDVRAMTRSRLSEPPEVTTWESEGGHGR